MFLISFLFRLFFLLFPKLFEIVFYDKDLDGNADEAKVALKAAQPELMRGVTKGIFHKKTASRKVSRLSKRVKALS